MNLGGCYGLPFDQRISFGHSYQPLTCNIDPSSLSLLRTGESTSPGAFEEDSE